MKFVELVIPGVWVIDHGVFMDPRGRLERIVDEDEYRQRGIEVHLQHSLLSTNPESGTLRGFHYQVAPVPQAKTFTCVSGAIHDVVVDLRLDSPTFLSWVAVELEVGGHQSLHVPRGCANAWMTKQNDTIIHYGLSTAYAPDHQRGFRYDDPAFDVSWPSFPTVVGAQDLAWPGFDKNDNGLRF